MMDKALDYGVCRMSLVPVRKDPEHRAELVSQLLFGEHYQVTEESKDQEWLRIEIAFDSYRGWIHRGQHHSISRDFFEQISNNDFKVSLDVSNTILYNKFPLNILLGSVLPISSSELFKMEEQLAFNGEAKNMSQRRDFEFLKSVAFKYINSPYMWGGKSPFGIDCSGLVQMVFRICGYRLPRDSSEQALKGTLLDFGNLKPGDLAFFTEKNKITHVGIVLEEEKIIHASGQVKVDCLSKEGIKSSGGALTHHFAHGRRILNE